MKTTTPSPVSPIDEAEVAFLKGEPLPEPDERKPDLLRGVCWSLLVGGVLCFWMGVFVIGVFVWR